MTVLSDSLSIELKIKFAKSLKLTNRYRAKSFSIHYLLYLVWSSFNKIKKDFVYKLAFDA